MFTVQKHKQNVPKFQNFEQYLKHLVSVLEKEIKQNDVEWLNLMYVAEKLQNVGQQPSTSKKAPEKKPLNKIDMDFINVNSDNLPELNLNPNANVPQAVNSDVEYDSESD